MLRRGEEASRIVLRYLALAKNEQDILHKVFGDLLYVAQSTGRERARLYANEFSNLPGRVCAGVGR
jgi:hypothetical protein